MAYKDIFILIIDDNFDKDDPLIVELEQEFEAVDVMEPEIALDFIKESLSRNIIILLDINMPHHLDGHQVLKKIRSLTFNIPVILYSAISEKEETFSDFINNKTSGFIKKSESSENIIEFIKNVALDYNAQLDKVMEDWLVNQSEEAKKKPFIRTPEGRILNYEDLLQEIRLNTPIGKKTKKDILNLTIDLFKDSKENQ